MSLLGIDIGSGSCKGVVFNYRGEILARSERAYATANPSPNMVEIDAELFWSAVVEITNELAPQVAEDPIEALAISSHGETVIPVRDGRAFAPALMNSDNRAVKQAEWWEKSFGRERVYQITGLPVHPMFALNKILWLRDCQPNLYQKTERFLSVEDYVLVKMGFPPYTDYSLASRTMAFDIQRRQWSDEILNHAGIRCGQLGIPRPSGSEVGTLRKETADILGLKEGTMVAMGGHDQPCGALGAGAIDRGEVADSAGTYECLTAASEKPGNSERALSYSLNSYCHVVPERYVTLAFFPAGIAVRWFVEQFCGEEKAWAEETGKTVFEVLEEMIAAKCAEPTGLCITPHFIGSCNPYWDIRATGVMVGLTPQITKHHIYKAIFEGIAAELAINAEILGEIIGPFDQIKIHGGNAKSPFSVQLRAAFTGKRFAALHTSEAVCQGAAMLAGIAKGIYRDAADAVKNMVKTEATLTPDPTSRNEYLKQFNRYRLIYPSLAEIRNR